MKKSPEILKPKKEDHIEEDKNKFKDSNELNKEQEIDQYFQTLNLYDNKGKFPTFYQDFQELLKSSEDPQSPKESDRSYLSPQIIETDNQKTGNSPSPKQTIKLAETDLEKERK